MDMNAIGIIWIAWSGICNRMLFGMKNWHNVSEKLHKWLRDGIAQSKLLNHMILQRVFFAIGPVQMDYSEIITSSRINSCSEIKMYIKLKLRYSILQLI